jgi:methionyl aminopeptidase
LGIKAATAGSSTGNIGCNIQKYVESHGFSIIRALVGHGIGKEPHQDPPVPNFGENGEGNKLVPNMAIAIEPMVATGNYDIKTKKHGWTVAMADGKNGAHFEHTVLITDSKPIIITQ